MQSRFAHQFGPSHKSPKSLRARLAPAFVAGALGMAALPAWSAPAVPHGSPAHRYCAGPSDVTLDFVAADINDVLKALALQTHSNIVSATDVKGTITVSLAHVSLEEALNVISKLSGYQYAHVGSTYVVGSAASVASLGGGPDVAATQTAVVPFTYANADDLANIIKQLVPSIKITPGKAASGAGGVFVGSGTQADIDQVRQIVAQAESALSKNIAESQTVVYNIKYANAADLVSVLNRLAPNVVVTPGPTQGFTLSAPSTADAGDANQSSAATYGAAPPATASATAVSTTLPTKGNTTSLLLSGSLADIARAQQILSQVDTRPAQINYEAKVTEINLNSLKNLGLGYDFSFARTDIGEQGTTGQLGSGPAYDAATSLTNPTGKAGTFSGLIGKFGTFARTPISNLVTVTLDALYKNGDAKLLSDPNISAVDGQPAGAFIGDTVRYIESITQTPTGQTVTTNSVNVGIKLYVTGKVDNDGYVTLNVHPEVSTITGFLATPGGGSLPQVSTREATTTVRVRDGETLAIGGLISEQDIKNVQKVPLLGDLPFLGALFRDTSHTHTRDEVVIFLKVSIQKDKPAA